MNYIDSVKSGFKNYATFTGRAARSEYWYWVLFILIFSIITKLLDSAIFNVPMNDMNAIHPLNALFMLGTLLPSIAVTARRLHDVGRSGWWMLISLTVIGIIPLLYWYCIAGTKGSNTFGSDPLK